jgi:hypothetical protein
MLRITLFIVAVALAGCASTRQERAAAFQRELPQLVTACNEVFAPNPSISRRVGINACHQLAKKRSLGFTDPATVRAYQRYTSSNFLSQAARDTGLRGTYAIPYPLPQVQ